MNEGFSTAQVPTLGEIARVFIAAEGGIVGWIATGRSSLKAKHTAHNPHVSQKLTTSPAASSSR